MYKEIKRCRICGNDNLVPVIDLGMQSIASVFPKTKDERVEKCNLQLVRCSGDSHNACGLVQIKQSWNRESIYTPRYGYRSGLNSAMALHLKKKVYDIQDVVELKQGDLVLDIGSNDATLLNAYTREDLILTGVDPIGESLSRYYNSLNCISDFFSAKRIKGIYGKKKAKVITAIAVFYYMEDPLDFMHQIYSILDDNGIFVFEQCYLPYIIENNMYDTICHEHIEYYALRQIKWLADRSGFKIINVDFNGINGGSICIMACKRDSKFCEDIEHVEKILAKEEIFGLHEESVYGKFRDNVYRHRHRLKDIISGLKSEGKTIFGYGASTKGNVLLQFCGFTEKEIPFIAEVNENKYGCFTPGSLIPIISEADARQMHPDAFLVLPWHFKNMIMKKEKYFLDTGKSMIMPLPEIIVIKKERACVS